MDDEGNIERRLIEMRPVLSDAVRDRIENKVIGIRRPRRRRVPMTLRAAALAGGLAAVLLLLAVFGAMPFGSDSTNLRADQDCTYVRTIVTVPQALVVTDGEGRSQLSTRPSATPGFVKRCR